MEASTPLSPLEPPQFPSIKPKRQRRKKPEVDLTAEQEREQERQRQRELMADLAVMFEEDSKNGNLD